MLILMVSWRNTWFVYDGSELVVELGCVVVVDWPHKPYSTKQLEMKSLDSIYATKLINLLLPALLSSANFRMGRMVMVDEEFCFEEETQLTVHKTSVFYRGDGFVVHNPKGELMLRFDSYYGPHGHPLPKDELVLMDATGNCLLTLIRKVCLFILSVLNYFHLANPFSGFFTKIHFLPNLSNKNKL